PRVRRNLRFLPGRRRDAEVPASDRPRRGAARARRGVLQGELALARSRARARLLAGGRARPRHGRAFARGAATAAGRAAVGGRAGLLAKNAVERGLKRKPWVKSSLAPGSKVVTEYYEQADLTRYLDELGFQTVGYGCTTCIGNSGPLPEAISDAVAEGDLVVCS